MRDIKKEELVNMYKEYFQQIPFINEKVSFILKNVITPQS